VRFKYLCGHTLFHTEGNLRVWSMAMHRVVCYLKYVINRENSS